MSNTMKLREIFSNTLGIPIETVKESLQYKSHHWDSVAHMAIVAGIDEGFDIMMEVDDIIDMSSFAKAMEILKKYGIQFD